MLTERHSPAVSRKQWLLKTGRVGSLQTHVTRSLRFQHKMITRMPHEAESQQRLVKPRARPVSAPGARWCPRSPQPGQRTWWPPPQAPLGPARHGPRGLIPKVCAHSPSPRVCPPRGPPPHQHSEGAPHTLQPRSHKDKNHLEAPPRSASSSSSKYKTWILASQLLIVCTAGKTIPCK